MHSSDFANFTRKFDTLHNWTYLLFEEFFNQGDIERDNGKDIAFLCDRTTVNVAEQQPGFASFIVIPTWKIVSTILPNADEAYQRIEQNLQTWKSYQETDQDKKVYLNEEKKNKVLILDIEASDIYWTCSVK